MGNELCDYCHRPSGNQIEGASSPVAGATCPACHDTIRQGGLIVVETKSEDERKRTGRSIGMTREGAETLFKPDAIRGVDVVFMPAPDFDAVFGPMIRATGK